jgi:DNA invertase Pin-like site-specific DNA recombinase
MEQEIKRVVCYRRVPTEGQNVGTSALDEQRERLAQFAASLGVPVVLDLVEVASGSAEAEPRRLQVARLLEVVGPGDVVAVVDLNRFARGPECVARTVRRILDKGARVISLAEGEVLEDSPLFALWTFEHEILRVVSYRRVGRAEDAADRTSLDAQTSLEAQREELAQFAASLGVPVVEYVEVESGAAEADERRTVGRMLRKGARFVSLTEGEFVDGPPPFGYRWATDRDPSDRRRRLVVHPAAAPIVREMFERRFRGRSGVNVAHVEGSQGPDRASRRSTRNGRRAKKG